MSRTGSVIIALGGNMNLKLNDILSHCTYKELIKTQADTNLMSHMVLVFQLYNKVLELYKKYSLMDIASDR